MLAYYDAPRYGSIVSQLDPNVANHRHSQRRYSLFPAFTNRDRRQSGGVNPNANPTDQPLNEAERLDADASDVLPKYRTRPKNRSVASVRPSLSLPYIDGQSRRDSRTSVFSSGSSNKTAPTPPNSMTAVPAGVIVVARLTNINNEDAGSGSLSHVESTAKLLPKASLETRRASSADASPGRTAELSTKPRTSFFEYTTIRNGDTPLQPLLFLTSASDGDATPPNATLLARRRRSSVAREKWANKLEFLLAVIGYAVDLGNIWRFPSVCYKHGGGAFLIPYLVMLFIGGLPMFYMELALGQFHRSGCLSIWKKICPMFKGIGYGICFICTFIACFYNAIIAHAVFFFFSSFASEVPWKNCDPVWTQKHNCRNINAINDTNYDNTTVYTTPSENFYLYTVLEMDKSTGIEDLGGVKPTMAVCLFLVFVAVYFALWKGPRSAGKAVWITATAPYIVLTALLIRGLTLPGAAKGISYYLTPNFDKLREPSVWTAAATQIFFSLGPGFGVLLALSSYNDFHSNCYRNIVIVNDFSDALVTSVINCFTSFFSGFVIFSTLGYMSELTNRPVSEVAGASESSLIFVVYPQAIATMSYSSVWSMIFFLMLITLGIDSTFSGIEALITGFCDEYPRILARKREIFVGVVVFSYYIGSLPTVTYGGTYVIPFLDEYGVSLSVLFIVMCEMIAVCWFYGVRRFSNDIRLMLGFYPGIYWRICWTCCPIFIGLIFGLSLYSTSFKPMTLPNYTYPRWSVFIGWIMRLLSCLTVPLFATYLFLTTSGTPMERLTSIITPQQQHASTHSAFHSLTFNNTTLVMDEGGEPATVTSLGGSGICAGPRRLSHQHFRQISYHHHHRKHNDSNNSVHSNDPTLYHRQRDSRANSIAHL